MAGRTQTTMKFETKLIHEGFSFDEATGALMPPIYMSSTFRQKSPGEPIGFEYTRADNPNFQILEQLLAALEGGKHGVAFSSGIASLTALLSLVEPQEKIALIGGVYGGTWRSISKVFSRHGLKYDHFSIENMDKVFEQPYRMILLETPTNPLLEIIDIKKVVEGAKKHGSLVVVDNTFATPYLQTPLEWGADLVWHSTTKYLGGHSDVIGGAAITNNEALFQRLRFFRMSMGLSPSPFDAWLTTRGIKTLAVRMRAHSENGMRVARSLADHPKVLRVYYPGLESHPGHEIAKRQMRGFSGIVSFEMKEASLARNVLTRLKLFSLAESLGGVESLANHPVSMTHSSIEKSVREEMGISEGLIRLSCGIEDGKDLVEDLINALG